MKKIPLLAIMALAVISCSTQMRIGSLKRGQQDISLMLSENDFLPDLTGNIAERHMDTLTVKDDEGHDIIIMKAIRDDNGDMVANEVIDAAVVTAKFKNIAERHGKVDLRFMVKVPVSMLDSRWQLRLVPEMNVLEENVKLEPVVITGRNYRKAQLRGYQQYERFINSIITDTTRFLREHELEVFILRNLPEIYKLKTDSTFVSDELVTDTKASVFIKPSCFSISMSVASPCTTNVPESTVLKSSQRFRFSSTKVTFFSF